MPIGQFTIPVSGGVMGGWDLMLIWLVVVGAISIHVVLIVWNLHALLSVLLVLGVEVVDGILHDVPRVHRLLEAAGDTL